MVLGAWSLIMPLKSTLAADAVKNKKNQYVHILTNKHTKIKRTYKAPDRIKDINANNKNKLICI